MRRKLPPKIELFLAHYLACGMNGAEAARRAGYRGQPESLAVTASRILARPAVRRRLAEYVDAAKTSAEEVMAVLIAHMRGDVADLFDIDESGAPTLNLTRAIQAKKSRLIRRLRWRVIRSKRGSQTIADVEMYDAQAAAAHIGRALGMFVERHEHSARDAVSGVLVLKGPFGCDGAEPEKSTSTS